MLSALGIEAEAADQIIEAHSETVKGLQGERDTFKEKAGQYDTLKKDYDKLQKQYDTLKDSQGNGNSFEDEYNKLKEEYDEFKKQTEEKESLEKVKQKYKELLSESKIPEKRHAAILKVTDFKDMKLDDKGGFKDKDKLLDSIKNDWSDFITSEVEQGAKTPDSKGGVNGSTSTMTKESILKIKDATERQKAIADNHELFGF